MPTPSLCSSAIPASNEVIPTNFVRTPYAEFTMLVKVPCQQIIAAFKHWHCQDDLLVLFLEQIFDHLHVPVSGYRINQLINVRHQAGSLTPPIYNINQIVTRVRLKSI